MGEERFDSKLSKDYVNPPANVGNTGDAGLCILCETQGSCVSCVKHKDLPEWGRSPGGGPGNPLQYSCLENSMDRRAWWATILKVGHNGVTNTTHFT